ncbi:hypothetical protein BJ170DRAFT_598792 [Xylariales sp. AK1849]|nr:hypothetical protein BJ170DRAFT_598792 [Xylariales sp. AK1849]
MQMKVVAVSLFAAIAAAQSNTTLTGLVSQLPECALNCFSTAASSANCAVTDFACLCGDGKSKFISSITPCVAFGDCSSSDLSKASNLAGEICTEETSASNSDVASASAVITSALGTATASATSSTGTNAAATPAIGIGMMGGAAALAAFAF